MSAIIGALRGVLSLESAAFEAGLTNAQMRMGRFSKDMKRVGGQVSAIGAAISVVGAGVSLAIRGQLNRADQFGEFAETVGVGVEALSRLDYAAKITGVSQETLGKSVRRLSQSMTAAMNGNTSAIKMFEGLGVSVTDAAGNMRGADEVMTDIADVFSKMPDGAEKTALAMQAFGKGGAEMLLMLNGGAAQLRALAAEADALGITLTQSTVDAAGQFNETLDRIRLTMQGVTTEAMAALLPTLQAIADKLLEWVKSFQALSPETKELIAQIAGITIVLGPLLLGIGAAVASLGFMAAGFAALLSPVGLVIAAIAVVAAGAMLIYTNWDGISAWFAAKWEQVKVAFDMAWQAIRAVLWDYQPAVLIYNNWGAITEWFSQTLAGLAGVFSAAWEQVKIVVAGWATDFIQFGRDIVDGLQAGIMERWDAMVAWFQGKADALTESFASWFGIQSPSRVMREMGGYITEGLALGIGDRIPDVQASMQGVAGAIHGQAGSISSAFSSLGNLGKEVFKGLIKGGDALSSTLNRVADQLLDMAIDTLFSGLFGGTGLGKLFGFADGGVFSRGRVQAFATGGVVNGATAFAMSGGLGVMGEAGPEAIMPLTRGPDGKLGVQAHGGMGGLHIGTIDARGAQEGVASQIVRAIQEAAPELIRASVDASRAAAARGY